MEKLAMKQYAQNIAKVIYNVICVCVCVCVLCFY